ncbi:MAG: hypothetical protein AB7O62_11415 [Pirellulales bacterium]
MYPKDEDEAQRLALAHQVVATFNDPNFVMPMAVDDEFDDFCGKLGGADEAFTQAVAQAKEAFTLFRNEPCQERQVWLVKALAQFPLANLKDATNELLTPIVEETGPTMFSLDDIQGQPPNEIELSAKEEAAIEFASLLKHLNEVLGIDLEGISTPKTIVRDVSIALRALKAKQARSNERPRRNTERDKREFAEAVEESQQFATGNNGEVGKCRCSPLGGTICEPYKPSRIRPLRG